MFSALYKYLYWHYFYLWPKLFLLWQNLVIFPLYFFSVSLHLKSLFSPWKRQRKKMGPGFHFDDFLGTLGFNLISRLIGATARTLTITYGLAFAFLAFFLGSLPVMLWPLFLGFSLIFYFLKEPSEQQRIEKIILKSYEDLNRLAYLLFKTKEGKFLAAHLGFNAQKLQEIFQNLKSPKENFSHFLSLFQKEEKNFATLFSLLGKVYLPFKNLLERQMIKPEDVYHTVLWYKRLQRQKQTPLILATERIKSLPGIGHDWSYGYTVEFDQYAQELTKKITPFPILVGREKELAALEKILLKTNNNNALVVGEPGVARHRLVETLAYRIQTGQCTPILSHKRVLSLNLQAVVANTSSFLEAKGLTEKILREAEYAGNIIVVIDQIEKFLSEGEGRIDLTDIFVKFGESSVGFIGITTPSSYHQYIENNPSLAPLFEKIEILPPPISVVFEEIEISIAPVLEKKHQVIITYPAIKKTIEASDRYLSETPFPAKAIELLNQAVVLATTRKELFVQPSHIEEFLSNKFATNIGALQKTEKEKLLRLEELLHQRIINQEDAVRVIASALRRARLDVSSQQKPIGSFLFLGPTGVGKTETAKALAEIYFGSEEKMFRFDMSQYQKGEGLERLIGSIKLGTPGELITKLKNSPFSLLLFDEFEKADKEIFNLFLPLLDEGYITAADGKKVNAKNCLIIATSNAGGEFIRERIKMGISAENLKKELIEYILKEKIFSPELLNRFDAVVTFTPLSEGHLREVAKLMLQSLNERLKKKDICLKITPELIKTLASFGFDPQFGARAMKRTLAEKIEDEVAKRLLSGKVKKGEEIYIDLHT